MNTKHIVSAVVGAGMVLVSVVPAFATDSCYNFTTGAKSTNLCDRLVKTKTKLTLTNSVFVVNDVYTKTNTGYNEQNKNTVADPSGVVTSEAVSGAGVSTTGNVNDVTVDQTNSSENGVTGGNSITGYRSTNIVTLNNIKKVNISIANDAKVINKVTTSANTGDNEQNKNTIAGGIHTGGAESTVIVETGVNSNFVVVNQ